MKRSNVIAIRKYDAMGNLEGMGDGVDLSTLLTNAASSAESAALTSVTSNQQVQQQANVSAVNALSTWILTNEQNLIIAGAVLGGLMAIFVMYKVVK